MKERKKGKEREEKRGENEKDERGKEKNKNKKVHDENGTIDRCI